jgi:hypothetical protein
MASKFHVKRYVLGKLVLISAPCRHYVDTFFMFQICISKLGYLLVWD